MNSHDVSESFAALTTPYIADAFLKLELPMRIAPPGIYAVLPGTRLAGRALPVIHVGSVDIFFEAMGTAQPGDVLVIDNQRRADEGCIGDLTMLEAKSAGLGGAVIWGCHRDTVELAEVGLPVFSYGAWPSGPRRLDPRPQDALTRASFGDFDVVPGDYVFADADGVLFAPGNRVGDILEIARDLARTERSQADAVRSGRTLRDQFRFDEYLERRATNPSYTLSEHLREVGGEIGE